MRDNKVEVIGGPLGGEKVPLGKSYLVYNLSKGQAVYRHYYHRGWDYYVWVGWNNPTTINCYTINGYKDE